ncbi:MAG: D-amino acid dehydrogenase [Betaproteobacteria bacterium]|nr:D-amino acid dehydrogenase [Betaproteobacteria bacterium]
MRVIVLGAGLTGTAAAYYLHKRGHEVTILDRQARAGCETSYANGGQISVSHAEPWANPSAPLKVLKWLAKEDAPLLFRLRADWRQWMWGLQFLRECSAARTRHNIIQIVNLGTYSRTKLQELRAEIGIAYDHLEKGILHFYTSAQEFDAAIAPTEVMREFGCQRELIDAKRAVQLEPALKPIEHQIAGATFTDADESGDARKFTQNLAAWCETQGMKVKTGTTIKGLDVEAGRISGVRVIEEGLHHTLSADAYVLAMGSFSPQIAAPLGLNLLIYPAKGYSATVPVKNPQAAYSVSLTDDEYKLVFSRLGDRLRIAGTAELNGYSNELNAVRCQAIIRRCKQIFPEAGRWEEAEFWTGLRPATPSNLPYIGRTHFPNLYLNTGHGTLGWTHACGSGAAIADIISGRSPEVDFAFYS